MTAFERREARAEPESRHHASAEPNGPVSHDAEQVRYAEMMARYLGAEVMASMADDDVTELYCNPQEELLRVDSFSRGRLRTRVPVPGGRLELFLNAVASWLGTTIGPDAPQLQAELPQPLFAGARLQGFVAPLARGVAVSIRKRPARVFTLDEYCGSGALPAEWRQTLGDSVGARRTIVVCGETGSGKSTFANALLREVADRCPSDRVVILEDTVELQCSAEDHLALRTAPGVSLAALVKAALRACPTRLVIGEVRDASALDFLDAACTGHPGGVCTVHAASARGALERLDRLAQRANVPPQRALVAEAVDLVVVLHRRRHPRTSREDAGTPPDAPEHRALQRHVAEFARVDGLNDDGDFILHRYTEAGTWQPY